MRNQISKALIMSALCLNIFGLTGCIGIDGSGEPPPEQQHTSNSGAISGFGNISVNGVVYNTDNASVYIKGRLGDESELNVGDYVVVLGNVGTDGEGDAFEIFYQPRVTGLIESIDLYNNSFVVMGQKVRLAEDTVFSSEIMPRNIEGFAVGTNVTVSGIADDQNTIRASRVEIASTDISEVVGEVELYDPESNVFHIDGTKIDYSAVSEIESELAEGRLVIVSGSALENGILVANSVDFDLNLEKLKDVDSVVVTGLARDLSIEGFKIDSLQVRYDQNTRLTGGTVYDVTSNTKVKVTGEITDAGELFARGVEIIPTPDMQVYGELQSVVPPSFGAPFLGTVTVQDHVFFVPFYTRFTGENEEHISFEDLRVGESVYVSAYADDVGNLYSGSIAVDNRKVENLAYEIQGAAYAPVPEQHSFSIFYTRVVTDENTEFTDGSQTYDEQTFYGLLTNQTVQVLGYFDFVEYVMVAKRVTFVYPETVLPTE